MASCSTTLKQFKGFAQYLVNPVIFPLAVVAALGCSRCVSVSPGCTHKAANHIVTVRCKHANSVSTLGSVESPVMTSSVMLTPWRAVLLPSLFTTHRDEEESESSLLPLVPAAVSEREYINQSRITLGWESNEIKKEIHLMGNKKTSLTTD